MGDKQKFAFDKTNFILGNGVSGGHFQCEKN